MRLGEIEVLINNIGVPEIPKFEEFQKIPRLRRGCVITEKIDGTNAQVYISDDKEVVLAGSRNRWLFPDKGQDNFGFGRWVEDNKEMLKRLGPGRHYGEWWGLGVGRRYGLAEKRFSLFNTGRWDKELPEGLPSVVGVVPVLYRGVFDTLAIDEVINKLIVDGSVAAPGFMQPEGVVIWHEASRQLFKRTIEKDEEPKGNK